MDKIIDLHTHTTYSDGSKTPYELIKYASKMGVSAMAITDHDSMDGIPEALEAALDIGIKLIPGIEISAEYIKEMHILGYFFDDTYKNMKNISIELKNFRDMRNIKMVEKLNQLGIKIDINDVRKTGLNNFIGRPHIATVMMQKGYIKERKEAFDKYIGFGGPAYYKKEKFNPEQAIKEILKAGGLPVLAHPLLLKIDLHELDKLLSELKSYGLIGIEAYYVDHSQIDIGNILRLAIKHDLIPTGGSDYHGEFKPDIQLGIGRGNLKVPYEVLERLEKIKVL